jgi:hypothetical protein
MVRSRSHRARVIVPSTAGRLVKMLCVGVHVVERTEQQKFFVYDRKLDQQRRAAIEPPPFGKADIAFVDLARRLRPAASAGLIAGVFGNAAYLDCKERQMKIAVGRRAAAMRTAATAASAPFSVANPNSAGV